MTKAIVALNSATNGGVYYAANIDFTTPGAQPTWVKYSTTGLANTLIQVMQNDTYNPYGANGIYVQLDNDNIYIWNGLSWTLIMDQATAEAAIGVVGGTIGEMSIDPTVSGTIYVPYAKSVTGSSARILKSVDYGANWSVIAVTNYIGVGVPPRVVGIGQNLIYSVSSIYPSIYFSNNGGSSWAEWNAWNTSSGGLAMKQDRHNPTQVYAQTSALDESLTLYTSASATEKQASLALGEFGNFWSDLMWIDPITANHHRVFLNVNDSDQRLYYTSDAWATVNSPSALTGITSLSTGYRTLVAALENNAYIMFGTAALGAGGSAHPVYAMNGEGSGSAWHVAGTNTDTGPGYTDAIPTVSGGYVAKNGIFVGEAPASTGVLVYSVEHDAFDTAHDPLLGDRSSWRDFDANTDPDGNTHASIHAEDIQAATPQRHNPWPASVGYAPVSDGNKYVATDITTQAELTAHTGTPAAHHDPVTLAADADTLLGLSTQQITLDSQNANTFLGGPTSGAAADPTFRAITLANNDIGDVDITGAGTGDIIYKPAAGDWVDYPLGIGSNVIHASGELQLGDIANGHYVSISDDNGETRLHGNARQWDDIQVTVVLRNTGATTRDPTFTKWFDDSGNTSRGVYIYGFGDEAVNEKELFFTLQMSHRQDIAADVHFHVHWIGDTTADPAVVKWGLEYCWKSPLEVFADTVIVYATTLENDTATGITAYKHNITEFAALTPDATQNGLSSIIIGRIFRNSSSGDDTYTGGVAGLLAIDAHILVDSFGSVDEYDKYESDFVLLESGDRLLLESGDKLLLE